MSGRRAALAVAFKSAKRNKKRTFYMVLLIALPVLVAVMTAVFLNASSVPPEEAASAQYGGTNVMLDPGGSDEVDEWINATVERLAPNSERLSFRATEQAFAPREWGSVSDIDLTSSLSEGILTLVQGREPTSAGEVVLTEHLATVLDAGVGDSIVLEAGSSEVEFVVVGLSTHPIYWARNEAVVSPESMEQFLIEGEGGNRLMLRVDDDLAFSQAYNAAWEETRYDLYPKNRDWPVPDRLWFIWEEYYAAMTDAELGEAERLLDEEGEGPAMAYVERLYANGVTGSLPYTNAISKTELLMWGASSVVETGPVIGTGVAALVLAEVAFIAGAAFATGTRRRLREIGLLGANGASVKHVRSSVVGEGLLVGLAGGLLGSLMAFLLVLFGRPILQRVVERRIDEFPFGPMDLAGPILVAVISCVIAAWVPARTASGVPTLAALQGRMPVGAPRRWIIPLGLALAGFGVLLLAVGLATGGGVSSGAVAVIGAVLMIGGTALLAGPIVAWVSKHAERFPITSRIVLRDSGRQRGRAAAAVAATMVILMAPVAGLAGLAASEASTAIYGLPAENPQMIVEGRFDDDYNLVDLTHNDLAEIRALLPTAKVAAFESMDAQVEYPAELTARKLGDTRSEGGYYIDAVRVAVANEELLELLDDPRLADALVAEGMVLIGVEAGRATVAIDGEDVEVAEVPLAVPRYSFPRLLVTPETAATLGGETRSSAVVQLEASVFQNPFGSQFDALWEEGNDVWAMSGGSIETGTPAVLGLGFVATMLVVLIVVATITALAAAEADGDLQTVVAVGATNSIRRRYLGLQSGLHTLIGAVLAIPLTLLLYKTVVMARGSYRTVGNFGVWDTSRLIVPWSGLALLLIGLPLAIGLVTALAVKSAPTVPPRRAT
jgi:cell division protein FtsX